MLVIGNIIYGNELINHTKVNYVNYIDIKNENNKLDDININNPTLFVGWHLLKNSFPQFYVENIEISILDKEYIKNSRFWEFSFNENKSQHINGVEMFIRNVPYYYFRTNYHYINIDPLFFFIYNIDDLKCRLPTTSQSVYNFKNEMLYVLNDNTIYGINLNMYNFYDIDNPKNIIELVNQTTDKYIDDSEGLKYLETYKTYPNFEELKRYIIVLLSKP